MDFSWPFCLNRARARNSAFGKCTVEKFAYLAETGCFLGCRMGLCFKRPSFYPSCTLSCANYSALWLLESHFSLLKFFSPLIVYQFNKYWYLCLEGLFISSYELWDLIWKVINPGLWAAVNGSHESCINFAPSV